MLMDTSAPPVVDIIPSCAPTTVNSNQISLPLVSLSFFDAVHAACNVSSVYFKL